MTFSSPDSSILVSFSSSPAGILDSISWDHVFVAGGSVLATVMKHTGQHFEDGDIDLFLYGLDPEGDEAQAIFQQILEKVCRKSGANGNARSDLIQKNL